MELKIEELRYSIYFMSLPYSTEDISVSITAADNKLNAIEMKTTAEGEGSPVDVLPCEDCRAQGRLILTKVERFRVEKLPASSYQRDSAFMC
jgi:hypothetical protein